MLRKIRDWFNSSREFNLKLTGGVETLNLKPDDILVIKCHTLLNAQQLEHLARLVKERLPDGQKVFVLDGNMEISKITHDQDSESAEANAA